MLCFPCPSGFQAKPTRGSKFASRRLIYPGGIPGSPRKKSPGGAFRYCWLLVPASNALREKDAPRPKMSVNGKYGSQRRPTWNENLEFTRTSS